MNKKRLLTAVFISALLSSTLVGTTLVTLGNANPYIKGGNKPPPEGTQPPAISASKFTVELSNDLYGFTALSIR